MFWFWREDRKNHNQIFVRIFATFSLSIHPRKSNFFHLISEHLIHISPEPILMLFRSMHMYAQYLSTCSDKNHCAKFRGMKLSLKILVTKYFLTYGQGLIFTPRVDNIHPCPTSNENSAKKPTMNHAPLRGERVWVLGVFVCWASLG